MGVLSDITDEFKKGSPQEKVLIVGGVIGVAVIALYLHNKSALPAGPQTGAAPTGAAGGGAGGIQTVPTSSGGQVPILPSGLCPLYDPQGNLIGYQPCSSGGGTSGAPTPTAPARPTPVPGPGSPNPTPVVKPTPLPTPVTIIKKQPTTVTSTMANRTQTTASKAPAAHQQALVGAGKPQTGMASINIGTTTRPIYQQKSITIQSGPFPVTSGIGTGSAAINAPSGQKVGAGILRWGRGY